jgi:hypothetical protein
MGRALLACLLGAVVAGGTWSVAAGAAEPPRASLEDAICRQSPNPLDRAVAITAVMRPLSGTERMQLKFTLLEKPREARAYTEVSGGDLGKWISPEDPTLGQRPGDVWNLRKQVVNLAGPAIYRFHVRFRWTAARGRLLAIRSRWAKPCDQP